MKRFLLLGALCILLSSCFTRTYESMDGRLEKFKGLSENQLLQAVGPANSTAPDGASGKILTYSQTDLSTRGVLLPYNRYTGSQGYATTYETEQHVSFFINPANKVYAVQHNLPPIQHSKLKVGGTILLTLVTIGVGVGLGILAAGE